MSATKAFCVVEFLYCQCIIRMVTLFQILLFTIFVFVNTASMLNKLFRQKRKKYSQRLCEAVLIELDRGMKQWWFYDKDEEMDLEAIESVLTIIKKLLVLDATVSLELFLM